MKNIIVWLALPCLVALAVWVIWRRLPERTEPSAAKAASAPQSGAVAAEPAPKKRGLAAPQIKDRIAAAEALAQKHDESSKQKLLAVLSAEDHPEVKVRIVETLGREWRFDPAVVAALVKAMADDEKDEVRAAASEALASLGEPAKGAVPEVRKLLQAEKHRLAAMEALGRIGPSAHPAVAEIAASLEAKKTAERLAAITALRRIGLASKAVLGDEQKGIVKALHDENAQVRENAALCLKRIGTAAKTEAVKRALENLKNDEDEQVRRAAESAWEKIYETR
jgi:HEAT repeat protein